MIKHYIENFLIGDKIALRKITKDDYEDFYAIEDVVESRLLMNDGIPFPPTNGDHEKFLSEVNSEKDEYIFGIELKQEKIFIGTISIFS